MSTAAPRNPALFALLIGIDEYVAQNNLRGCVNDVEAMQTLLINRYDIPSDRIENHIRVLTNRDATRANILQAFEDFLINNQNINRGDQILFHFSGHGSQMAARPEDYEPDGLNETLVPHDSRTENVFDIPDKTLAALLDRLAAAKGDQITVILDSCHSGSATRRPEDPSAQRVRRIPADSRVPPADLDAEVRGRDSTTTRATGPSGWATADLPYVLLAGCRDREESNEHQGQFKTAGELSGTSETTPPWHGALTYFTLQVLKELPEGATYADLHERVAALVNANYPNQMPQCEGARERQLFGSLRVQRDPFIPVQQVDRDGKTVTLGAGLVHGMRPGTELALYPAEVRTRDELPPTPIATVTVMSVAAATARAAATAQPTQSIPQHARGVITRQAHAGLRLTVRLESAIDTELEQAVAKLRRAIEPSPYLFLEDDPNAPVDLLVRAEAGQFWIYDDRHELLVQPEDIAQSSVTAEQTPENVRRALESIVRYRTVLGLRNEDPNSELAGKVKLRLRRYVDDSTGRRAEDLPPEAIGPSGELAIYFDPDHEEQNLYVVDLINESALDVYPHVFTLSPDYSISSLHPGRGIQEAVAPNKDQDPYPIGLHSGTHQLALWLPEGWDASQDFIKAIVTTNAADLKMLEQPPLDVPPPSGTRSGSASAIETLLEAVVSGSGTRHGKPRDSLGGEDWAVAELRINTIRRSQTTRLEMHEGKIQLSEELTLIKPDGFTGEVSVTTLGLASRGEESDPGLQPPPGLARFPDLFEPIGRSGVRSLGSNGLVVTFNIDESSRQLVSQDNPLRLELSSTQVDQAMDLVPVVFDGEDYLLAGYAVDGGRTVELVSLPQPVALPADGGPTPRGVGRTLRLFLFKKLGRFTVDIGLRRAEVRDGQVIYGQVERSQFRRGQSVALFIHGFMSDSHWMVQQPADFLLAEVWPYEHLLTWDYETFGTSIEDNGEQLALALKQQCGFDPDDEITVHVYAHSMGAVVARCMIELAGGHTFVDRAVLAGAPNRGSTLASSGRGLVFLMTRLLNRASLVPILGGINWTLNQLYEQGAGLADLAVDSPVLKNLNGLDAPSNVPYLVLAGENRPAPEERRRLDRLARKVLDTSLDGIFGEQNDVAVGLSSLKGLRGGAYPALTTDVLPCDHFSYFVITEGQNAIKTWMANCVPAAAPGANGAR